MRIFLLFLLLTGCLSSKPSPYSIGRDQTWFPLNLGQKTANITAFSTALIQAIAKQEKQPIEIYNVSWDQLFPGLSEQRYAGVLSSLSPNSTNRETFTFSDPFLLLGPVLVVPQKSDALSLEEMTGTLVGTSQYDDSVLILQKYPTIIVELYSNLITALDDVARGKIDAVLVPSLDAHSLVPHLYPGVLKIATAPLNNKALRLITIKGENEKLMMHFNKGLHKLYSKNRYQALLEKFSVL